MECLLTMTINAPTTTLVIIGNGPGEVAGWAIPLAAEARRIASEAGRSLEVALCLPPCQFASGQEQAVATAAGVFDHVVDPRQTLRLGLGLPGWAPSAPAVILHVGGGFWYPRRLARRWRAPAFAFVERSHISRAHHTFKRIFVPTEDLRDRLVSHGVPGEKVTVTGDPRYDAVLTHQAALAARNGEDARPKVTFLAGSRDTVFSAVFPFWVRTAAALRERLPDAHLLTIISPFVSPELHRSLIKQHRAILDGAGMEITHGDWSQIVESDLVLTIPGTNTLELAIMRIPSMVVLPFSLAPQIPMEGLIEWITRIPRIGPPLRLFIVREYIKRRPYVALPNMRVGRRIMPELIGAVTPEQVADESARLIRDERARAALASALEAIPVETGASRRILDAMRPAWTAV